MYVHETGEVPSTRELEFWLIGQWPPENVVGHGGWRVACGLHVRVYVSGLLHVKHVSTYVCCYGNVRT